MYAVAAGSPLSSPGAKPCPPEGAGSPGAAGLLDLHTELSPPRGFCTCRTPWIRLRSSDGELVHPRGGCVNQCDYCAKLAAVENSEMLALDAMEGNAPRVWMVLTTAIATLDMKRFYKGREKLLLAIRRKYPEAQYAALLEFTTGYGPRSGGKRRPHWNVLLKGVPVEAIGWLLDLVERIWCAHVDARIEGQHVGEVSEAGGLMRYIAHHFQKESQAPPKGFMGQRFNCSRGYFTGCTRAVARRRAIESLRRKREIWRADQAGLEGTAALEQAEASYRRSLATVWVVCNDRGYRIGAVAHRPERQAIPAAILAVSELRHLAALLLAFRLAFEGPEQLTLEAGLTHPPGAGTSVPRGPT